MLKKHLGLLEVFCIAAGAMISSGLFILPGIAFAIAGPAIILSYLLAGLLMIPTMFSQAELATAMPKSGGSYFFVERSLGPLIGTIAGLANWMSITMKASFALIGIGSLGLLLLPGSGVWTIKWIAITACVCFAAFNIFSVKGTGRLQIVLTLGLLAITAFYVISGITSVAPARYYPLAPSMRALFAVSGMVFVSFGGLTKVVDVSEEVRRPHRNLPLGMFLALGAVNLLYVLVVFTTVGTVDAQHLSGSLLPLTLGAKATMGRLGEALISLAGLLAFATTANAGILSASRSPMAMSRDGLLPAVLSKTSHRWHTPHLSIALTATCAILAIAFLSVADLVKTASTIMLLMFVLVNVSVIIMRQSGFQSYRPKFKVPLYPWLQIATIGVYGFLIVDMGTIPLIVTGAFALLACVWYLSYVHRRIDRESAFVFLVRRIVSREVQRSELEQELRQLSMERDGGTLDRFDHLVKECPILDIEERIPARELFRRVAAALSGRLNVPEEELYERLLAREKQSSTVVRPGLAIPHVIVEGDGIFEIMLIRAKGGIIFSDLHPPVKTVFFLVGSLDERNYHLRALMTIAHIVQKPDFEKRWFQAHHIEQLRDIVLLSSRKREEEK